MLILFEFPLNSSNSQTHLPSLQCLSACLIWNLVNLKQFHLVFSFPDQKSERHLHVEIQMLAWLGFFGLFRVMKTENKCFRQMCVQGTMMEVMEWCCRSLSRIHTLASSWYKMLQNWELLEGSFCNWSEYWISHVFCHFHRISPAEGRNYEMRRPPKMYKKNCQKVISIGKYGKRTVLVAKQHCLPACNLNNACT